MAITWISACDADIPRTTTGGDLAGQVVVSGPLRHAAVSIDQIDLSSTTTLKIRTHLADAMTDDNGQFSVDVGEYNGLFLIAAHGGDYVDLAATVERGSPVTIQLDPTVILETVTRVGLFEGRDDVLVSPIGHLIAARTRAKLPNLGTIDAAERDAAQHLNQHFGALVDWTSVKLASLDTPATSPTEPVRAAFMVAALSYLAKDIADQAAATPQDVNVVTLTHQLATDLATGPFDGGDNNDPDLGSGLQVGFCASVPLCAAVPQGTCTLGCRAMCDVYAGTPRAYLAGEMTSVVGLSSVNHTGLITGDILNVARTMAANRDPDLFGAACSEALDRIPPKLAWIAPTPADAAYVRATFPVKVAISDDTDPMPQVTITGGNNELTQGGASAMIDSTQMMDGALDVVATGRDMAGNVATLHRGLHIDNTPPLLTLDATGYVVDNDTTWWTTTPSPAIAGTVTDGAPVTVAVSTPASSATAMVTGSSWSGAIPGPLDLVGADVTVVATDAAGNQTPVTKHIRADITPPVLTVLPSTVADESAEVPTFSDGTGSVPIEAPIHIHTGTAIDLASGGDTSCPAVTKFSYLLGSSLPPFGVEQDGQGNPRRNPLHYTFTASDDGVGIASGSTQYRVGFRSGATTSWIVDWTAAGTPTPVDAATNQYDVGLFSDTIPQLATTQGVYDVQFRSTDRLGRITTADRCFTLTLRAPPLHFQTTHAGEPANPFLLTSLKLGQSPIAARLLNADATGASLLDEDVTNGTGSTVYLQVTVTRPAPFNADHSAVFAGQNFKLDNTSTVKNLSTSQEIDCTTHDCDPPSFGPVHTSSTNPPVPVEVPSGSLSFPVKVFELDSNYNLMQDAGQKPIQLPCIVCGSADVWTFAIPPRASISPFLRFKIMMMIGQVSQLWPSDNGMFAASQPFSDTSLAGVSFTGSTSAASTGCSHHIVTAGKPGDHCDQTTAITPYRALIAAILQTSNPMSFNLEASPTAAIPASVIPLLGPLRLLSGFTWTPDPQTSFPPEPPQ